LPTRGSRSAVAASRAPQLDEESGEDSCTAPPGRRIRALFKRGSARFWGGNGSGRITVRIWTQEFSRPAIPVAVAAWESACPEAREMSSFATSRALAFSESPASMEHGFLHALAQPAGPTEVPRVRNQKS